MKLAVTFTNPQIVRNYLFDTNHNILNKFKYDELTLICNGQTYESVSRIISTYPEDIKSKIKIEAVLFKFGDNQKLRFLNLVSKCHLHSKFSIEKIFRSKSKLEISTFNLIIRILMYIITFRNRISARILRKLILFFLIKSKSHAGLSFIKNYDLVLALSLTDDLDTLVTSFAKLNCIKSIGTVRSWDNLTSHGLIRVKPEIFYCHSAAMAADLSKYQYYDSNLQNTLVGNSFWINFSKTKEIKSKTLSSSQINKYQILYGARGAYFYPDEEIFLAKLITFVSTLKTTELTILMHPRFPLSHKFRNQFDAQVIFYSFEFDNKNKTQSYTEYLEYLANYDLIISSGSTILLDACVINKHLSHIGFEMCKVPYWESIKRHLDFRQYYKSFLELSATKIMKSFDDLILEIELKHNLGGASIVQQDSAVEYFMGSENGLTLTDVINGYYRYQ